MRSAVNIHQKGESPGKFGDRTGAFKDAKPRGFTAVKCAIVGRARQALEMLVQAGQRGLSQREALEMDPTCWRLAASVGALRDYGFLIQTKLEATGRGGRAARYVLRGHSFDQGVCHGR
jgi:hypothetical protein